MKKRCQWCTDDPIYIAYHDHEWGIPVHDDIHLFEMLVLEGNQAGLSWLTILKKRENYRKAFDGFRPEVVARYDAKKVGELLINPGIVRNKAKIEAAIQNARSALKIQEEYGSLDSFLWDFVEGRPIQNAWKGLKEIPCQTKESDLMSRELKKREFKFAGTKICYSFMQAVGMVNDHEVSCFCYERVRSLSLTLSGAFLENSPPLVGGE
jgi:DNA-3-methyladenine glycosylase I